MTGKWSWLESPLYLIWILVCTAFWGSVIFGGVWFLNELVEIVVERQDWFKND